MATILAIVNSEGAHRHLRDLITEALPEATLFTALNGSQGIEWARTKDPEVILLDYFLPDMDGCEVCRQLKQEKDLRDIPIAFLTTINEPKEARLKALESGAESFLTTPVDSIELTAQISTLKKIKSANRHTHIEEDSAQRKTQRDYQLLFREMMDAFALHDIICNAQGEPIDYRYLAVNPAFEKQTGLNAEHIVGRTVREILPGTEQQWIDIYSRVAITGEPTYFESYSKELDKHFEVKAYCPAPNQFVTIFSDITSRKQIEAQLSESEEKYRSFLKNVQDVYYETSVEGTILEVSPSIEILSKGQYHTEDLIGRSIADFYANMQERQDFLTSLKESGRVSDFEITLRNKDGSTVPCSISAKLKYDAQGQPKEIIGSMHDITKRTLAKEALRASNALYLSLVENIPAGVFRKAKDGRYDYVNERFCTLKGLTKEEILRKNSQELVEYVTDEKAYGKSIETPRQMVLTSLGDEHHLQILRSGKPIEVIEEFLQSDGSIEYSQVVKTPIFDSEGCIVGSQGMLFDITDRKLAEEQILLNTERLNRMLNIYQYNASNIQNFLDFSLNEAIELTSSKLGYIYFYNEQKQEFLLNSWSKDVMKECSVTNPENSSKLQNTGIWGEAVRQRKEIIINNFEKTDPLKKGYPTGHVKLEKFMTIPIFDHDQIVAVVGVANKETDYDNTDLKQLGLMMNSVWRIVKRIEAEERIIKLNKAVEQSPASIVITDPQGNIEYVNPKFTTVTGYSYEDVLGKNPRIHQSGECTKAQYQELWQALLSGKEWHCEFHNVKKNGELYWEDAVFSPIINQKGEITHLLAVKEDISEKKKMIEELIQAKEKAEESDHLKTAFLHNISHEIRTPMNAIVGFSNLLNEPDITPERQKEFSGIIVQSSTQLLSIITDIVDIATIESGQEKIYEKEINLNQICALIAEQASLKAQKQQILLRCNTRLNDKEVCILTDETKIVQILSNLVNNAIKFTKQGSVDFGYRVAENTVEFYVKDTGIGIPPHMHEEIFKRFRQVEHTSTRQFGGSGLGLSISKAYVELLGGRMWLTSELNQGSTFFFTIPFKKTKPTVINEQQTAQEPMILNGRVKTLLIAEDEDFNFMLLEEILSGMNFNIIRAINGIESVDKCKENPQIDLVLMDLKMPLMNGYEATKQIREIRPNLPVLAITAYTTQVDKNRALDCGCCDFISKPFNRPHLLAKIKELIA